MSRLVPVARLLAISRQNVQFASRTAVQQAAGISVAAQRHVSSTACVRRPGYGLELRSSRLLLKINCEYYTNVYFTANKLKFVRVYFLRKV